MENDSKIRAVKDRTSDLWANKKVQILYSNRTPMDVVRAKVCIWACLWNCGNMTMRVCIYEKSDVSDSSLIVNLPYHCLSRSACACARAGKDTCCPLIYTLKYQSFAEEMLKL